jgi:hypothetical protein
MFIAMNRFRVKRGAEEAFEKVWLSRDSYLDRVPGFVEFQFLLARSLSRIARINALRLLARRKDFWSDKEQRSSRKKPFVVPNRPSKRR